MPVKPSAFFLQTENSRLFCLAFEPAAGAAQKTGAIVVPPFAEEMNRCRRQMFLISRALSDQGMHVLLPDLQGTGDSDGDFVDASVDVWRNDIVNAAAYLQSKGIERLVVVGFRFGGLLAAAALTAIPVAIKKLILVQPVINGEQYLNQFLRLRLAADMTAASGNKVTTADLRKQLQAGEILEVAGYELNGGLVSSMDGLQIETLLSPLDMVIEWCEISQNDFLSPAASRLRDKLSGNAINMHIIKGEPFWSTQEIAVVPPLADKISRLVVEAG